MSLKIAVLVKQVPDHEATVQISSPTSLAIEERYVCSFFDEIAVEAALGLGKAHPGARVKAFSAGGKRAVEALRRAMALGIDDLEQVGDEAMERADSLTVARALAAALVRFEPDVVLCGKQAGDDDMGAIGPMISGVMGIPVVGAAVSLEVAPGGGTARVGRSADGQIWTVEADLPAVICAEKGLAEPRVPVVMRVMKAMRAKAPAVTLAELGVEPGAPASRLLGYCPPPSRPEVRMVDNVDELARLLQQRGVLS
jgi:electron transfer flavoprotein beta subunit